MFGRDPVLPLNTLLGPKMRYLGTDLNIRSLEALKNMFEIAATNLKMAREKGDPENNPLPTKLQPGDTVLAHSHTKEPFDPKYVGDYQVVAIRRNQVEIRPSVGGPMEMKHVKHVKYILPANRYIKQLPYYNTFGRRSTFRLNPDKIPDLHWSLADSCHTTDIGLTISSTKIVSTNYIDINTLSYAQGDKCKMWCGVPLSNVVNTIQNNTKSVICGTVTCTKDDNKESMVRI